MLISPVPGQDLEKADILPKNDERHCCHCNGRTWRKIVVGSVITTNMASLATVIYGVATQNNLIASVGAGSGFMFSMAELFAYLLTHECKDVEKKSESS